MYKASKSGLLSDISGEARSWSDGKAILRELRMESEQRYAEMDSPRTWMTRASFI